MHNLNWNEDDLGYVPITNPPISIYISAVWHIIGLAWDPKNAVTQELTWHNNLEKFPELNKPNKFWELDISPLELWLHLRVPKRLPHIGLFLQLQPQLRAD